MPSVFISHSTEDREFCLRLKADLEKKEIAVWLDATDLLRGEQLESRIRQAVEQNDFLVVVLSSSSVDSQWTHFEVGLASSQARAAGDIRVLPVVIEDCGLPVYIQATTYADFTTPDKYAKSLEDLVRSIFAAHRQRVRQARLRRAKRLTVSALIVAAVGGAATLIDGQRKMKNQLFVELSTRAWQQMDSHPDIAKALADDLVRQFADNPEALRIRGWIYNRDHQFAEALKMFNSALKLSPNPTTIKGIRLGQAHSLIGIGSDRDLKEARVILEELAKDRSHWNAQVNLATLTFREGRFAEAAADFETACKTLRTDYKQGERSPALGYVMVGWALALAKSPTPAADAVVLDKLSNALCYDDHVREFLVDGKESIGFYGYGDFSAAWKELQMNGAVGRWLKQISKCTLKAGQTNCS